MTIVIECPPKAMFALFDSNTISSGMIREVPGGATIQLGEMPLEKRHLPDAVALIPIAVTCGSGVAIHLFGSWLYERLKSDSKVERKIRINRVEVEFTQEGITRAIKESIEIEDRK